MKRLILFITITSFFGCSILNAKNDENKINYIIAKKLFIKKEYNKTNYILYKIIKNTNPFNKYTQKAKLYIALININTNNYKNAKTEIKDFLKLYQNSQYLNHAYYIYSIILYNYSNKITKYFPNFKKYKRDQSQTKKVINILKKIQQIEYKKKINKEISLLTKDINKNEIYIGCHYIKNRNYITVIKRMNINKNFIPKTKYDYKKIYLTIKSYNELFLKNISKNILKNI